MSRLGLWLVLCTVLLVGLVACQSEKAVEQTPAPSASPSPATPVPVETEDLTPEAVATPGGAVFATGPITLTVWTIQEFAPADADSGGRLLLEQLLAFDRSHPDVDLDVVVKRATGPGGIDEYLRLASQVAPEVIPDIAIMDANMLLQASRIQGQQGGETGVIYPLDDLLLPEVVADLFPVARQLGTLDGQLMGVPFMLDLEHIIYNSAVLTETAPTSWDAILASGGPYVFPAAEDAPVDTTLIHYLSAGGLLFDGEGQPHLALDPLTEVFRFYQRGDLDHVIPVTVVNTRSLAESWSAYRNGNALVAHVLASDYLSGRDEFLNTTFAAVPGPDGPGSTLIRGWMWTVCTPDQTRQRLAAELLVWLLAADNLGVWSYASQWLPSTESAFAVWPVDDSYVSFAREQITNGILHPDAAYIQAVQPRLSKAVRDVLLGNASPAAAASASTP